MARIRSIKPDYWTDSAVVACSPLARLLFIGIWNHADDYGVVKDDPEQLRRQILPDDHVDGEGLIDELVKNRLLLRMTAGEVRVLCVRTWELHQKVDSRSPGRYGDPETFTPVESPIIPPDPARSLRLTPLPVIGREGSGEEGNGGGAVANGGVRSKRKTRCPDDFVVTEDMRTWASREHPTVDIDRETSKFRDHHEAKGSTFIDWSKAWKNWVRRAEEWAPKQTAPARPNGHRIGPHGEVIEA